MLVDCSSNILKRENYFCNLVRLKCYILSKSLDFYSLYFGLPTVASNQP